MCWEVCVEYSSTFLGLRAAASLSACSLHAWVCPPCTVRAASPSQASFSPAENTRPRASYSLGSRLPWTVPANSPGHRGSPWDLFSPSTKILKTRIKVCAGLSQGCVGSGDSLLAGSSEAGSSLATSQRSLPSTRSPTGNLPWETWRLSGAGAHPHQGHCMRHEYLVWKSLR